MPIRLSAAPRAVNNFECGSWGFAALHPRLYAITCSAGWESMSIVKEPTVKTPIEVEGDCVMKLSNLTIAACFVSLLFLSPSQAQEMHIHQHDASEKLGQVNFTVSCKPAAR